MTGDVFLIFKCAACDEHHDHHIGPLDPDLVAAGLALSLAWVFERAVMARDCATLITLLPGDRPHALAVDRQGDYLYGYLASVDRELCGELSPVGAYAYARRVGIPLVPEQATEGGMADLVAEARELAEGRNHDLARLLAGVDLS